MEPQQCLCLSFSLFSFFKLRSPEATWPINHVHVRESAASDEPQEKVGDALERLSLSLSLSSSCSTRPVGRRVLL